MRKEMYRVTLFALHFMVQEWVNEGKTSAVYHGLRFDQEGKVFRSSWVEGLPEAFVGMGEAHVEHTEPVVVRVHAHKGPSGGHSTGTPTEPGQSGSAPGHEKNPSEPSKGASGEAPGQTKEPGTPAEPSKGKSSEAPGQTKEPASSAGKSADAPGQQQDPGKSAEAPGQAKKSSAPGKSAEAPGQAKKVDAGKSSESPGHTKKASGTKKDK